MPLEYEMDNQLKELTEISSEYLDWFLQLTTRIHYAEARVAGENTPIPESFTNWLSGMREASILDNALIENLNNRYERLVIFANTLLTESMTNARPPVLDQYTELARHFEKFMDTLRRAEKELILDKNGIDEVTGLRRKSVLQQDLDREMQRLSRQGKPFSLALVRIDHFEQIEKEEGENIKPYLQHIARLIKQSLRSFDDAYRTDDAEFILALKQADVTGGIRALERLKELLELNSYEFTSANLSPNMASLSCCVAEPLPDDSTDALIENMRGDLGGSEKDDDTVLEYYELSPLERFVKTT